jgi:hypothetical protein
MRNYLDPLYLAITEEAWNARIYADIFASLNDILEYIDKVEESTNTRYQLVKFNMNYGLCEQIYSNNPFKNDPKIQAFYTRLFNDKILPELLQKRAQWCPSSCTLSHRDIPSFSFKNRFVPDEVMTEWNNLFTGCLSCDSTEFPLCLLSPTRHQTVIDSDSEFISQNFLMTHEAVQLFKIPRFLSENIISEASLRKAIEILYHQRTINDNWDSERQSQTYVFQDVFFSHIEREHLVDEDDEYKERFVSSLAQVVYDIDVDIRKHKYGKIAIEGKKYDKYSADIFKMGRGTDDRRCSRIFYCKVKSVIHFYEYNPDFHASE